MKNSRSIGELHFNTKKTFPVSIEGKFEDRNEIICHDVNSKCETAALDLEQLFMGALGSLKGSGKEDTAVIEESNKKNKEFFENESPSHDDVAEQAKGLEMAIMFNREVKVSEILEAFKEIVIAGRISTVGDVPMTTAIWDKIDVKDKIYICYMYTAFFANPLERL